MEQAVSRMDDGALLTIADEIAWYLEHVHVVYRRPAELGARAG